MSRRHERKGIRTEISINIQLQFLFRLERWVNNAPFVVWINTEVAVRRLLCLLEISLSGFYLSLSVLCWPREQLLRKFSSKDFMSDDKKLETEIFNYSDNKGKRSAFVQCEVQMHVSGNWVIMTFGEERGVMKKQQSALTKFHSQLKRSNFF